MPVSNPMIKTTTNNSISVKPEIFDLRLNSLVIMASASE